MKNFIRNFDAAVSFLLKLIFVHDLLYQLAMLPMELFMYKRESDVLISSRAKDSVLLMSPNKNILKKVQARDYLNEDIAILLLLKKHFSKGIHNLDFSKQNSFKVEVNERFYSLLKKEWTGKPDVFEVQLQQISRRKQVGAKLLLISSSYLWKCLLQGRFHALKARLLRDENVLTLRLTKVQRNPVHEVQQTTE